MPVLPLISDVDLLGYGKRVIDFDSQIACVATLQVICEHVGLRPGCHDTEFLNVLEHAKYGDPVRFQGQSGRPNLTP